MRPQPGEPAARAWCSEAELRDFDDHLEVPEAASESEEEETVEEQLRFEAALLHPSVPVRWNQRCCS